MTVKTKRYSVIYGVSSNIQHEDYLDGPEEAVQHAKDMLRPPHGYLFSFVYENQAHGEVELVWDYRNGYNSRYTG